MRRRVGFLFICSAAIPIAIFASAAWACGALTTAKASPSVAAAGQTITVTGRNFGASPTWGPVQVRFNSRTGPVLKDIPPTSGPTSFSFTDTVQVPAGTEPGWYVLNFTQSRIADGIPKSGSPGRTTVRVQGAGSGSSTAPWGAGPTSGGSGGSDLPLPGILLSVALLATGLTLVARDRGKKATHAVLGA